MEKVKDFLSSIRNSFIDIFLWSFLFFSFSFSLSRIMLLTQNVSEEILFMSLISFFGVILTLATRGFSPHIYFQYRKSTLLSLAKQLGGIIGDYERAVADHEKVVTFSKVAEGNEKIRLGKVLAETKAELDAEKRRIKALCVQWESLCEIPADVQKSLQRLLEGRDKTHDLSETQEALLDSFRSLEAGVEVEIDTHRVLPIDRKLGND